MKKRLALGTLLVLLALIPLTPAHATQHTLNFRTIDSYVSERMEQAGIPGLSLAIVHQNEIVYLQGYGIAGPDNQPMSPQMPLGIGSMTKSFTALAVMQLVDQKQIELDAPVKRYLPFFRLADTDASDQITVQHLLHQTSGIPTHAGFWEARNSNTGDQLEQRVRQLSQVTPEYEPGTVFEYSNANYDTLGLLVQVVSDVPYETYIQEQIFAPLGMQHSSLSIEAAREDGLLWAYQDWYGVPVATTRFFSGNRGVLPGGGIYASAEDMGQYLIAHLNTGRSGAAQIISPEGLATLHQPPPNLDSSYAMGWSVRQLGGEQGLLHNGGSPAFSSTMLLLPTSDWGVVVLTNINSMPLGSPQASRIIAADIADMVTGNTVDSSDAAGLQNGWYIKLGILLLVVWGIVTLPFDVWRWRRQYRTTVPTKRVIFESGVDLAMALFLLFGLPRLGGIPLWALLQFNPDIGVLLLAGILTSLVRMGLRLVLAFVLRPPPDGSMTPVPSTT